MSQNFTVILCYDYMIITFSTFFLIEHFVCRNSTSIIFTQPLLIFNSFGFVSNPHITLFRGKERSVLYTINSDTWYWCLHYCFLLLLIQLQYRTTGYRQQCQLRYNFTSLDSVLLVLVSGIPMWCGIELTTRRVVGQKLLKQRKIFL